MGLACLLYTSKQCFQRALGFAKSEAVLSIAALLAVGSMAAVPPDKGYLDYIDWDTLALLFSLMAVSKGRQLSLIHI